jgi:3-deoxy-manno-octulosonate cytidylyltransferase (CMP-KDO synthetase)
VTHFPKATQVINIQGDEPLIEPSLIDELAQVLIDEPQVGMATAANEISDSALQNDPNVVKCVLNSNGEALYFSRSPLPFQRNPSPDLKQLRHKGIYAYQRTFLEQYLTWEPSPLELAESLEQLRALENGVRIKVIITGDESGGVDTRTQADELELFLSTKL